MHTTTKNWCFQTTESGTWTPEIAYQMAEKQSHICSNVNLNYVPKNLMVDLRLTKTSFQDNVYCACGNYSFGYLRQFFGVGVEVHCSDTYTGQVRAKLPLTEFAPSTYCFVKDCVAHLSFGDDDLVSNDWIMVRTVVNPKLFDVKTMRLEQDLYYPHYPLEKKYMVPQVKVALPAPIAPVVKPKESVVVPICPSAVFNVVYSPRKIVCLSRPVIVWTPFVDLFALVPPIIHELLPPVQWNFCQDKDNMLNFREVLHYFYPYETPSEFRDFLESYGLFSAMQTYVQFTINSMIFSSDSYNEQNFLMVKRPLASIIVKLFPLLYDIIDLTNHGTHVNSDVFEDLLTLHVLLSQSIRRSGYDFSPDVVKHLYGLDLKESSCDHNVNYFSRIVLTYDVKRFITFFSFLCPLKISTFIGSLKSSMDMTQKNIDLLSLFVYYENLIVLDTQLVTLNELLTRLNIFWDLLCQGSLNFLLKDDLLFFHVSRPVPICLNRVKTLSSIVIDTFTNHSGFLSSSDPFNVFDLDSLSDSAVSYYRFFPDEASGFGDYIHPCFLFDNLSIKEMSLLLMYFIYHIRSTGIDFPDFLDVAANYIKIVKSVSSVKFKVPFNVWFIVHFVKYFHVSFIKLCGFENNPYHHSYYYFQPEMVGYDNFYVAEGYVNIPCCTDFKGGYYEPYKICFKLKPSFFANNMDSITKKVISSNYDY